MKLHADTPLMIHEAREAPERVAALLSTQRARYAELGHHLQAADPPFAVTVGRGSSDHAGLYARYMLETALGLVTASAAPSVVTAYGARLKVAGAFVLALSQSGASPDIVRFVTDARTRGGITVALVNQLDSPLGQAAETALSIEAGEERAVAATKSFLCTATATALLVAEWTEDRTLRAAMERLPEGLTGALEVDWSAALPVLVRAERLLVVARGRALAVASEMALKFKEVAGIQAEAFSAAEVLHGPLAVVDPNRPVLVLGVADETLPSVLSTAERLRAAGARVIMISADETALGFGQPGLTLPRGEHPALESLLAAAAFYPFVAALASARGLDPDHPPHLTKVTRTL